MKIRNIALVLIMALLLSTFSGCGLRQIEQRLDAVEDKVENKVDRVEDKVEYAVESAIYGAPEAKAPKAQAPKAERMHKEAPVAKNFEPVLSAQEAESIALEHAGLKAADVKFVRSEYEIDDGVKQYDISFYQDMLEYEYEIDADKGNIISFDMDR